MSKRRTEAETSKLILWLRRNPGWSLIHRLTGKTWYLDQMDSIPPSLFRALRRKKPGSILTYAPWKRAARSRLN